MSASDFLIGIVAVVIAVAAYLVYNKTIPVPAVISETVAEVISPVSSPGLSPTVSPVIAPPPVDVVINPTAVSQAAVITSPTPLVPIVIPPSHPKSGYSQYDAQLSLLQANAITIPLSLPPPHDKPLDYQSIINKSTVEASRLNAEYQTNALANPSGIRYYLEQILRPGIAVENGIQSQARTSMETSEAAWTSYNNYIDNRNSLIKQQNDLFAIAAQYQTYG